MRHATRVDIDHRKPVGIHHVDHQAGHVRRGTNVMWSSSDEIAIDHLHGGPGSMTATSPPSSWGTYTRGGRSRSAGLMNFSLVVLA